MLGALLEEVMKLQSGRTSVLADPGMRRRSQVVEHEMPAAIQPWVTEVSAGWSAEGSGGKGSASEVPWTRLFDAELSPRATFGWYVVYLFDGEGSAVYLSLMQGTTMWNTATKDFVFREDADLLRRVTWAQQVIEAAGLKPAAFDGIPYLGDNRLARGYVTGTVHAIRYAADAIPSEDQLQADVVMMGELLKVLYAAEAATVFFPGDEAPEVVDADLAVDEAAGNVRHRKKGGQGYRLNTAEKLAIEKHAVKRATKYFRDAGYSVKDTGATNPYDLLLAKEPETLYVEVKGTTSLGEEVILTRGEVEHHRTHYPNNALVVVHSIVLDRSGPTPVASGGELVVIREWDITDDALTPVSFRYRVPKQPEQL
ncbi:MrcB family domain-containing protein [Nocardia tengchongensis]|uniref:MrcB family domain-containing protein n=1 Tax=Nocardia tengchongensis TaxID=2055889 RepID=UPI0036B2BE54